ncbi:MAG: ferric reductase-like transmembrane domain-containing protein [Cyanobacteria bacterium P01_D01_bin.116]
MMDTKFPLQEWRIVGFLALLVGTICAFVALIHGVSQEGMRMAIRVTGRTSTILFVSAFIASSLQKIWKIPLSTWMLKNRRYLGLSMAVSHTYHAVALIALWFVTNGAAPQIEPLGTLGYVLLIVLTVTSFKVPAKWLGKRGWKILHKTAMHYLWLGLLFEYGLKLSKSDYIALPFVILLVLAMVLRFAAGRRKEKLV